MNELWLFDVKSYTWQFINTTIFQKNPRLLPAAREQHNAVEVGGNLYIFGGKSRQLGVDKLGKPILSNATDVIYNDLWRLTIQHPRYFSFKYDNTSNLSNKIPQDSILRAVISSVTNDSNTHLNSDMLLGVSTSPRTSYCIQNITVKVSP